MAISIKYLLWESDSFLRNFAPFWIQLKRYHMIALHILAVKWCINNLLTAGRAFAAAKTLFDIAPNTYSCSGIMYAEYLNEILPWLYEILSTGVFTAFLIWYSWLVQTLGHRLYIHYEDRIKAVSSNSIYFQYI